MKHLRKHIARLALAVVLTFSATPARGQMITFDPSQATSVGIQIKNSTLDFIKNMEELGKIVGLSEDNLKAFNQVYGFIKDNSRYLTEAREIMSVIDECSSRTNYILSVYRNAYEKGQIDLDTMNRVLRSTNSTLKFYMRILDKVKDAILQKMSWKEANDFMQQQLRELLAANFDMEEEMNKFLAELQAKAISESFNLKMDELLGRGEREGMSELSNVKGQLAAPPAETLEEASYKLHGSLRTAFRIAEYLEAFILALFAVLAFYAYEKGGGNQHKDAYIKVIVGTLFIAVLTELFKYLLS